MIRTSANSDAAPAPVGGYSQAVSLLRPERLLFISGQIPVAADGTLPASFAGQARQVWANLDAQLVAAGMSKADLVKVTVFLADRAHAIENREVRTEYLGDIAPAMTVIITGIFDASWLLEIEAVAAQ
ncbi:RidA family protein [soil metagenome]